MSEEIRELEPITLYLLQQDAHLIRAAVQTAYQSQLKEFEDVDNKILVTLENETKIIFHIQFDKQYVKEQRQGMHRYFSQVPMEDKQLQQRITHQMLMFQSIIDVQIFTTEKDLQQVLDDLFRLANMFGCFVLYPNMSLYTQHAKLLINKDGKSDFKEYAPKYSTVYDHKESVNDKLRREESVRTLREEGFEHILINTPSHTLDTNTDLYTVEEYVNRLAACFATNVKSEMLQHEDYDEDAWRTQLDALNERYNVDKYFTPEEKKFIKFGGRENSYIFGWRYECSAMLAWTLSLMDNPPVSNICDVPRLSSMMWNSNTKELIKKAKLRTKGEILQLSDTILRYHWTAVDARLREEELPQINESVVYFRQYALEWILQMDDGLDFDKQYPYV